MRRVVPLKDCFKERLVGTHIEILCPNGEWVHDSEYCSYCGVCKPTPWASDKEIVNKLREEWRYGHDPYPYHSQISDGDFRPREFGGCIWHMKTPSWFTAYNSCFEDINSLYK